jgi:hypothetical protein
MRVVKELKIIVNGITIGPSVRKRDVEVIICSKTERANGLCFN